MDFNSDNDPSDHISPPIVNDWIMAGFYGFIATIVLAVALLIALK